MNVQVLAAVMDQNLKEIASRMQLDSDAVIVNQCDRLGYEEMEYRGHRLRFYSFPERGVGRSRNEAIMRADGDICLFSDQDIVYEAGYGEAVAEEFRHNPRADMILFNITVEESRRTYHITKRKRVRWYNCGRYGAVSFAIRRESLLRFGVTFSLLFGGGARYSNGEDSLFLHDCLKKGLHLYAETVNIGREILRESTWFQGYHEKFFYDRGVLYAYLYGPMAELWTLRYLLVKKKTVCGKVPFSKAWENMRRGIREGRDIRGRRQQ